jgi:hypothetical protein
MFLGSYVPGALYREMYLNLIDMSGGLSDGGVDIEVEMVTEQSLSLNGTSATESEMLGLCRSVTRAGKCPSPLSRERLETCFNVVETATELIII